MSDSSLLKVRAWIADAELMTDVSAIYFSGSGVKQIRTMKPVVKKDGHHRYRGGSYQVDAHRAVLMRRTGLQDKNGTEICEGDIVRICHYEPFDKADPEDKPEYSTHEVQWGDIGWVVDPTYSEEFNDLGMVGMGWEEGHLWMEVIGNIYENPGLMEPAA